MNNEVKFEYEPLSNNELQNLWKKHKQVIEAFIKENDYDSTKIYINEKAVLSVIAKVDQRRKYFNYFHGLDMSEYKEVALICFWYIKLHPICAVSKEALEDDMIEFAAINEKLAVYYLLATLKAMLRKQGMDKERINDLPEEYIKELIYSFTYRDLSKESLILLFESMAVFMGINPYSAEQG